VGVSVWARRLAYYNELNSSHIYTLEDTMPADAGRPAAPEWKQLQYSTTYCKILKKFIY